MTQSGGIANRNFGLDALRAAAISAVFLFHASQALGLPPSFQALTSRGWMGVDLFFVLSGYLIGLQAFAARQRTASILARCSEFWIRRWTRTVPLYLVVLFVYVVVKPWLFHAPFAGGFNWKWLVFLQNYGDIRDFGQSWSLCIEEQFYFAFPLIALVFSRLPRSVWLIPLGVSFMVRLWTARDLAASMSGHLYVSPETYLGAFRFPTIEMLDSISVGVFLASCREVWSSWSTAARRVCGLAGASLVIAVAATSSECPTAPLGVAFLYSVLALGFGAVLVAAEQWRSTKRKLWFVRSVSLWSYSIYLWHELFTRLFVRYTHGRFPFLWLVLYLVVVLGFSKLSYELIEKPGLSLRTLLLRNSA